MSRQGFIARHEGGRWLLNYAALWAHTGRRPIATLRAHCQPIACDLTTRQLLYDADQATAALAQVKTRRPHTRPAARRAA